MSATNIFKDESGNRIAPASWSKFKIPEDWKVYNLGEKCSIQTGKGFKSEYFNANKNGAPLIKRATVNGSEKSMTYTTENFDEKYKVQNGDVLVSMDGNFGVRIWKNGEAALNQRVCIIRPESKKINKNYLGYVLQPIIKQCEYSTGGTTVPSLSNKQLKKINIPVPSMDVQKQIVSLLSDVDEYISNTDERIELLKKKKRGMYNLVYSNNNEYNGLFKDNTGERIAPASWSRFDIPEDWSLCNLGETCNIQSGNAFSSDKFNKDNNGVQLIKRATVNQTESEPTYTTESVDEKYIMCNGDVLVSMDGNFEVRIWDEGKAALNQRVCRISPEVDYISNKYLGYVLQPIIKHCEYSTGGTTVSSLSVKKLKKINIPYPPLKTQKEISGIFRNIDKSIRCAEQDMEKMEKLKTGLLQQIFR